MKLAHLILAHNAPEQLERLVTRLLHPDADIYIHLDKKTDIGPFKHLTKLPRVYFIYDRVTVYWGSSNIVDATLSGFEEIVSSGKNYQYVNLLSGQDYPLKPAAEIHQYLTEHPDTAFMKYLVMYPDWPEALPRVQEYHFNNLRLPGRYLLQAAINKILPRRKMPGGMIPVGRSQWFTIPLSCVRYIIDYWEQNADFRSFMKYTWAPDEFVFQTMLYNSPYKSKMLNNDLRYIDWSAGGVSPRTFTLADVDALVASNAFYARKFDMSKHAALLDLLDKKLGLA